ncbi:MAG: ATP-dependent metallopeptidase FtsH/Yme1/Tma family protein, partial [Blastocatellia bacterium]
MNSTIRQVIFWVVIIGGAILLYRFFHNPTTNQPTPLPYTELLSKVKSGEVQTATIEKEKVTGKFAGGAFTTDLANDFVARDLVDAMEKNKVKVDFKNSSSSGMVLQMVVFYAPFILIIAFWIFMLRQMQSGGNKALSFGKSRAKLLSNQQKRVTFKDVAGVEEAKEELQEIIEFLKEPQKFQKLGGRIPKGVLMMGPPGTGKTLLARAIAGEA